MYYARKVHLYDGFQTSFQFRMTGFSVGCNSVLYPSGFCGGGDGFAFVIQKYDDQQIGCTGSALGYARVDASKQGNDWARHRCVASTPPMLPTCATATTMALSPTRALWAPCVTSSPRRTVGAAPLASAASSPAPRPSARRLLSSSTPGTTLSSTTLSRVSPAGGSMLPSSSDTTTTMWPSSPPTQLKMLASSPTMPSTSTSQLPHPSPTWLMARTTLSRSSTGRSSSTSARNTMAATTAPTTSSVAPPTPITSLCAVTARTPPRLPGSQHPTTATRAS